ncbi:TonB-dependent receptor [Parasegetibacter sp. NRK P23]|uniref:SusC/RagA family TonB-linked outer membrane protein n=1 Tax=Parasegetibacter sp. NRK P23 TaxID=2942999 RepID=UPI002043A854|nr:TonB-dependent receptor [Parasegetibacter sp. NRK P23]MCM5527294.1 TonB-dependent receptor [Parasegetibacter sp. NRK P23]
MRKLCFTLLFLITSFYQVFAQSGTIQGKITEEGTGAPLPDISVVVSGEKNGVKSGSDGRFSLRVSKPVTLVITGVGFKTMNVPAEPGKELNITLQREVSNLDEYVVIGYQQVKRKDLTSSVSSVSAKDLKDIPINSTAEALAGRLAGVQIIQSEGTPGASAVVKLRGGGSITQDNAPLYVVDGIQVENALDVLAPQDIETIDVLKDAAATAIYGARGANGVVIITTKGGKAMKTRINYNGLVGVRQLANKLSVMKPYDFVRYQYERSRGSSADELGFLNSYGTYADLELYKEVPFVDWQDEMFGRDAMMQTHNVSMVGGNADTKFNLSLSSNKEEGVMLLSDFDRKILNFKFDHNVSKKLKVGAAVRYNNTVINGAGTASEGSSGTNRLRHSVKYRPLLAGTQDLLDYDPDYALQTNANGLSLVNPILLNEAEYRKNRNSVANLSGFFNYELNKYLSFKSTLGFDITNNRQLAFNDTITSIARQNSNMPTASITTFQRNTLNNSNVLTFTMNKSGTTFSERNALDVLVGHEVYENVERRLITESRYFPVGITAERALGNMGLGSAPAGSVQPLPTSTEFTNKLLSFFGRVNYAFDKKYLFTASLRADGSSKFAEGKRWGYFPSASAAWRISEEDFMKNTFPVISDLKLRASYGEAGNNRIPDFLYMQQFLTNRYYSIGEQLIPAYFSADLANANLQWETTIARNIGVDVSFFNNRLQLSLDAYKNTTRDLLVEVPVPTSSGYVDQFQNVGATTNKGVEVQLSGTPVTGKDFSWNASFNISFNKNEITSLGRFQDRYRFTSGWGGSNQPADYMVQVGQPVGTIFGLVTDGFYTLSDFDYANGVYTLKTGVPNNSGITSVAPQPGVLKFKDLDGDGDVDDSDRTIIGNTQPKFFGGLNQQFTYKNFDMSVFVNFQVGNDVYNANKLEFTSGYTPNSNMLDIMNGRWTNINAAGQVVTDPAELAKLNENATIWSPLRSASSFYVHSWAIEDGSFLRVNNITLGYTFPKKLMNKLKASSLRVYGTVNNLAVFTNYSGYDPEVNTRRSTPLTPGVDYSAYPRSRAFIFGLNLSL